MKVTRTKVTRRQVDTALDAYYKSIGVTRAADPQRAADFRRMRRYLDSMGDAAGGSGPGRARGPWRYVRIAS